MTSSECVDLARTYRGLFAVVGIHPNEAAEASENDWRMITDLVQRPGVVAVGETGLDRYWDRTPFELQEFWFDRHLDLAHAQDLAVVIHSRDCQREIIDQLRRLRRPVRGVMHSFTGSWADAEACLELGLHLSFAGMVTFTNKTLDPLRVRRRPRSPQPSPRRNGQSLSQPTPPPRSNERTGPRGPHCRPTRGNPRPFNRRICPNHNSQCETIQSARGLRHLRFWFSTLNR